MLYIEEEKNVFLMPFDVYKSAVSGNNVWLNWKKKYFFWDYGNCFVGMEKGIIIVNADVVALDFEAILWCYRVDKNSS